MSKPRPRWPAEEFDLWRQLGDQPNNSGVRESAVDDKFDALWLFKEKTTELLEAHITAFVNERCLCQEVGSPDLRRIARVALSHAIARCADNLIVKNSAISREHGLPWTALAEVTQSKGITGFQRRWGNDIEEVIAQRATERDQNGPLDGDRPYVPVTRDTD